MSFKTSKLIIEVIEKKISKNNKKEENIVANFAEDTLVQYVANKVYMLFEWIKKIFYYPFKVLPLGSAIWLKDFKKFSIVFVVLYFLFDTVLKNDIDKVFNKEITNYVVLLLMALSAFISIYAVPSSYCTYKMDEVYFDAVAEVLNKNKINLSKLNIVQSNLSILENKAKLRVKAIKAVLAFSFAIFLLLNKNNISAIANASMSHAELKSFFIYFGYFLGFYVINNWYSKVILFIFDMAQIACNEYKYKLDESTN